METIDFDGYSEEEKRQIALKFLMPKLKKAHGFKQGEISISNGALNKIIRAYTREAGVRNLERELASVLRKMARKKECARDVGKLLNKLLYCYIVILLFWEKVF